VRPSFRSPASPAIPAFSRYLPLIAVPVAAALLAAGCSREAAPGADVRPVRAMAIEPKAVTASAELPGEVRPRVESRVGFQVGGRVSSRRVETGQRVRRGDVMATLDASDLALSAAAASAELNAARVDRDQQRADLRRFEDLHQKGFISGAELERRRAQSESAEARYRQASALADVSGNQAAHAVLRAPADGVVSGVDAEVGQVVASGQSVVRLALAGDKEVAIAIPEARLEEVRQAPKVTVSLWAHPAELAGRIREIAPIADPATRTYAARVTLLAPPPQVAFGMTASVRFATPSPGAVLAVPLGALLRDGDATYVWRLDRQAMTVQRVPVALAGFAGNDAIVGSGVQAGDTVVTAGVHLLQPGQKVRLLAADPARRADAVPGGG
jgi:RND family efflux transporter MFP subunit